MTRQRVKWIENDGFERLNIYMRREYIEDKTAAKFVMLSQEPSLKGKGMQGGQPEPINTFVFNQGRAQIVMIDEVAYTMPPNCILPLVGGQHFVFEHPETLTAWQFNREFYCIVDHDAEVGCVGFLFYGIQHPMFITLSKEELAEISHLKKVFAEELLLSDHFQGEMLRTLLKRVIIQTTRIAKRQSVGYQAASEEKMDLVRKFALLLEGNYKTHHDVGFYASLLNKSPKTLSNVFLLYKQPAPSVIIRSRILLEAKRYLNYTDKTAKEIAYELGFDSPAHFSRFFKNYTKTNITSFRRS
ncbi:AraC-type DNA-binding protein [Arachidicoccus rhizosphaerae]|jgi:AraC-like DNA-binding protein|uniref:AraC-type DNA-binding protein n=1 Tax=Arachidicoccus rhizosphaerae TaxID=551991 RepID=A0A1H4BGL6_9BACT|nr:helix-turn-helix domain-containing protein [Arachidicoccus rhizosphaerae]SEA47236.1 AraC-type DNA-binding protein [Arachidicoccus rhizosphaerae]